VSIDLLTLAALGLAVVGLVAAFAGRWVDGGADWARAFVTTGIAIAESGLAFRSPSPLYVWLSGFLICVALHRWVDVFASRRQPTRPTRQTKTRKSR
jgi:hypothetical protein